MPLIKSVSGIRGIVDPDCGQEVTLTPEVAQDVGRALATYLHHIDAPTRHGARWLVAARDGRPGGHTLLDAFARGAWDCGGQVINLGITTTPTAGFAVDQFAETFGVVAGVVITASHNPQQWNGIKLLLEGGRAPTADEADRIFGLLDDRAFVPVNIGNPPVTEAPPDAGDLHVQRVVEQVDRKRIADRPWRVVLDSVNGAGVRPGRMVLEALGCHVGHLNDQPEAGFGRNPEPTAENLKEFAQAVVEHAADVGFAQDPDADRLAVVDETGRYIGEEYTLALCAKHAFATRPGPAVTNLSTSRMIDDLAAAAGPPCVVHRSAVGEANVVQMMKEVEAVIGGEGNGGVIDPRVVYVRDSISSMATILQLMTDEGRQLSQIVDALPRYSIVKHKLAMDRPAIDKSLHAVRQAFGNQRINDIDGLRIDWPEGWVHVRASNTEPIMRIIAEAADESAAQGLVQRVRQVIQTGG